MLEFAFVFEQSLYSGNGSLSAYYQQLVTLSVKL